MKNSNEIKKTIVLGRDYTPAGLRFILYRHKDISGVSGTGVVAEGWCDPLGEAIIVWVVGEHRSTEIHHSVNDLMSIHGHEGSTELIWID